MKRIVLSLIILFGLITQSWAATYYVSPGGSNTAPYDTWVKAATTLQTAYAASSDGDTITMDGGSSGNIYDPTTTGEITKNLIIQASTAVGHNGTVTIRNTSGVLAYAMRTNNSTGITLNRLIFENTVNASADCLQMRDKTTANDCIIRNSVGYGLEIRNLGSGFVLNRCTIEGTTITKYPILNSNIATFNYCKLLDFNITAYQRATIYDNNGTAPGLIFNNCVIFSPYYWYIAYSTTSLVTFKNCALAFCNMTLNTGLGAYGFYFSSSGGTINTINCIVNGNPILPTQFVYGTGTWNSTNDKINAVPLWVSTREGVGYILLGTDASANIDFFTSWTSYAPYISATMAVGGVAQGSLSASDKTKLQTLYKAGHDIASYAGAALTSLAYLYPLTITYSGAATDVQCIVAADGSTITFAGTGVSHGPYDLTTTYKYLYQLVTLINTLSGFSAAKASTDTGDEVLSSWLKGGSTALTRTVAINIPYDDTSDATNRFMAGNIVAEIAALEAAIHEDSTLSAYRVTTYINEGSTILDTWLNWIMTNTAVKIHRNDGADTASSYYLGNISLYRTGHRAWTSAYKDTDYATLSAAQKEVRLRQAVRSFVNLASHGFVVQSVFHSEAIDFTLQEMGWIMSEYAKYRGVVKIVSLAQFNSDIRISGLWTDGGSGVWTRTFADKSDYHLTPASPGANGGVDAGLTTDYDGNSVPYSVTPDIGCFEWRPSTGIRR